MKMRLRFFINAAMLLAAAAPAQHALAQEPNEALRSQMLSHVEKIFVIDSINVPREDFLSHYKLQPSAGRILSGADVASALHAMTLPDGFRGEPFTGFTNEFNDYMIWAQEDTTGYLRLAESVRLVDGSWSAPKFTPPLLNAGVEEDDDQTPVDANAAFPFMMDDGQTLYFAADNGQSVGGYDIFIATKDPSDGEFLIPGNLGMPFNSPFNDYMMVIDRQTGVGWWASDRNQLDGEVTIYIYAVSDLRENIAPDDPNLHTYATLSGWQQLLDEEGEAMRRKYLKEIAAIRPADTRTPEFTLPMPGGTTYKFFNDFKNSRAAALMKNYLKDEAEYQNNVKKLENLREHFHLSPKSAQTGTQIADLEEHLRSQEVNLKNLLSEVYRLETNSNTK